MERDVCQMILIKRATKIIVCFILVFAVFCVVYGRIEQNNFKIITNVGEFYEEVRLKRADMLIVDLRDEIDYIEGHIGISINIPFDDEGGKLLNYLKSHRYKNKKIYLICYGGDRAASAFNLLVRNGYPNLNYLKFGYKEFIDEVDGDYTPAVGECSCKYE